MVTRIGKVFAPILFITYHILMYLNAIRFPPEMEIKPYDYWYVEDIDKVPNYVYTKLCPSHCVIIPNRLATIPTCQSPFLLPLTATTERGDEIDQNYVQLHI